MVRSERVLQAELAIGVELLRGPYQRSEHAQAGLGEASWETPVAEQRPALEAFEQSLSEVDAIRGGTADCEPLELQAGGILGWGSARGRELQRFEWHRG